MEGKRVQNEFKCDCMCYNGSESLSLDNHRGTKHSFSNSTPFPLAEMNSKLFHNGLFLSC